MSDSTIKIGREGVGMYWFINTEAATNLVAARERMREIASLGFTEVWIAARYLHDPSSPRSVLLGPLYETFLRTVADEADHLGLLLIPFIVPCGFGEIAMPQYDRILIGTAGVTDGRGAIDLGLCPEPWTAGLVVRNAWMWKTVAGDCSARMIDAASVTPLTLAPDALRFERNAEGRLTAHVRAEGVPDGREIGVVFEGRKGEIVPWMHRCAADVTNPDTIRVLEDIVKKHEATLGGRRCYAGLAFDEPNIGDTSNDPNCKRERERRFYWSDSMAAAVRERRGIDLAARPYLLARPDTVEGFGARVAYFETIQDCLVDVFAAAMKHSSVPLLGTHDWSGDRDRAIYNTHDQLDFARVRAFAATDISGVQFDFDYAPSEALHAFTQKESCGKPRAMLMTDHFGEPVDLEWLLHTCERHAALGVDYMLLHAFGEITGNPPLWTRTESWIAYREPRALEWWAARMKQLSRLNEYRSRPGVLVIYPRLGRLVHCGDRYAIREWDRVMFSLFRAHYAPMTITQKDFDAIEFDGAEAAVRGNRFRAIVLPCFTGLNEDQMEKLAAFHRNGGHVLFTKSNPVFTGSDGRPAPAARKRFERMIGVEGLPAARRMNAGERMEYAGETFTARRLADGVSEYDDACMDFGGRLIVESVSAAGGRAVLAGFLVAALSCTEEMHRMHDTDTVRLLDAILRPMTSRAFSCASEDGKEDYDVLGLVRERDGETLFSAHRRHGRMAVARVGGEAQCVVYMPPDPPNRRVTGCNVFVHHAEETAHVVCNPFGEVLREIDLGRSIARVTAFDGKSLFVNFEGSRLKFVLPPGRDLRFSDIAFGARDSALPSGIEATVGEILEARVPMDAPGRLIVRATGPGRAVIRVSLCPDHGKTVTAECATSKKAAAVRTWDDNGRVRVEAEFELCENIENDLVFTQA